MKLFKLVLFLCFTSSTLFAQSNYHEGHVLKNNGDTLKGYINYHEWTRSPKVIDFKFDKSDKKAIHFRPDEVKGFRVDGMETFVSYVGIISNNKIAFPNYPQGLDTSKVLDTVFLQQIATGDKLTLYYNNDEIKTRFFIAGKDEMPKELKYYIYYNNENQVATSPIFLRQLVLYVNRFAPDNQKLMDLLKRIDYDQSQLETFVNALNGVDGSQVTKREKSSRFYVGAGVSGTTSRFIQYSGTQTSTSVSPKINFGIDLFNNPNVQQLIFRADVSLWYVKPRFESPVTINDEPVTSVYSFNQYNATITPQLIINLYNKDNFKFYVDGGWNLTFSTYSNNKSTVKNEDAATTAVYTHQKPYDLTDFWSSFPLQVGVVFNKRVEIYASYTGYSAYTKYEGLSIANQSTNVGVKFYLK